MKVKIAYLGAADTFARLLSSVLASNGYDFAVFSNAPALASAVSPNPAQFAAILVDMTIFKTLPAELFPVIAAVPTVMLTPQAVDDKAADEQGTLVRLPRPLSIPRLLTTIQRLGTAMPTKADETTRRSALVVDDDPSFRFFVEEILKTIDFEVLTACDGQEALDLLAGGAQPTTFVVDLEMPRIDGPTLIAELRKRIDNPSILIMTGTQDIDLLRWGRSSGQAYALIEKPFSSRTFLRYFNV